MSAMPEEPDLAASLAAAAGRAESARRMPDDVADELTAAGYFRLVAPREHGGAELALTDVLDVVRRLARADGSAGWVVGQAAVAQVVLSRFAMPTIESVYTRGPDVVGAGAAAPKGRARYTGDRWRVSGRWPFVTGIARAGWFFGQCVAFGPGVPEGADGVPATRAALLWPDEIEVLDTWHTTGLRGTGSHDVAVARRDCPDDRLAPLGGSRPTLDRPAYRVPAVEYSGLVVAASGLGIAEGAIDEIVRIARSGRRPSFSPRRLAESPVFQDRLGEAVLELDAARALVAELAGALCRYAASGDVPGPHERARVRGGCHHVAAAVTRAVGLAHTLAGGAAVYEDAPIGRRLRDVHALTQHATTARESVKLLGAVQVDEIDPSLSW